MTPPFLLSFIQAAKEEGMKKKNNSNSDNFNKRRKQPQTQRCRGKEGRKDPRPETRRTEKQVLPILVSFLAFAALLSFTGLSPPLMLWLLGIACISINAGLYIYIFQKRFRSSLQFSKLLEF
jgi:hypothetical protein